MAQSWTKAHDSTKNAHWVNFPSTDSPIVDDELNRNEVSVDTIDDRVLTLDTIKAEQSDLLLAFKDVSLNTSTGVITFTLFNNTTKTIDTLLEKIAINFDYDDDPTSAHYQNLIITLEDGTVKYVDMSALITQYEFVNSTTVAWTVGNDGSVTANVVDGSITESKLQPNFLADCRSARSGAESAEANAIAKALVAEGWAVGKQDGVDVPITSPYFRNNAKWYKDQAQAIAGAGLGGLSDVVITNPQNGQVLTYDASFGDWENKDPEVTRRQSLDLVEKTTVFNADGSITITAEDYTENVIFGSGSIADVFTFSDGTTITKTITFNADGSISESLGFTATVTVSFLSGTTVTLSKGSTTLTATTNPYTFTVTDAGVWTLSATRGNYQYTENLTLTSSSSAITKEIILPEGSTVTPTDDVATLIYCAGVNNSPITTIAGLLADSTTLTAVINSNNAIDYLARSTSFATDICADSSAMALIGANNYASNKLLAEPLWFVAICDSSYKTSVLNFSNPVMTSNTTPEGEVTAVSIGIIEDAYLAFDGNLNTEFALRGSLYYSFATPAKIRYLEVYANINREEYINISADYQVITQKMIINGLNKIYFEDEIEATTYGISTLDRPAVNLNSIKLYGREDV